LYFVTCLSHVSLWNSGYWLPGESMAATGFAPYRGQGGDGGRGGDGGGVFQTILDYPNPFLDSSKSTEITTRMIHAVRWPALCGNFMKGLAWFQLATFCMQVPHFTHWIRQAQHLTHVGCPALAQLHLFSPWPEESIRGNAGNLEQVLIWNTP
jgi:hypothetical protein